MNAIEVVSYLFELCSVFLYSNIWSSYGQGVVIDFATYIVSGFIFFYFYRIGHCLLNGAFNVFFSSEFLVLFVWELSLHSASLCPFTNTFPRNMVSSKMLSLPEVSGTVFLGLSHQILCTFQDTSLRSLVSKVSSTRSCKWFQYFFS